MRCKFQIKWAKDWRWWVTDKDGIRHTMLLAFLHLYDAREFGMTCTVNGKATTQVTVTVTTPPPPRCHGLQVVVGPLSMTFGWRRGK